MTCAHNRNALPLRVNPFSQDSFAIYPQNSSDAPLRSCCPIMPRTWMASGRFYVSMGEQNFRTTYGSLRTRPSFADPGALLQRRSAELTNAVTRGKPDATLILSL
jgi:hypothetical protein